jgi:hypothetical protein
MKEIDIAVNEYKFGNAKILLSNSTLFGCGMNFENATDILFVHRMDKDMEQQVIGRSQRMGRTSRLNIIYLEYENESIFMRDDKKYNHLFYDEDDYDTNNNNNKELEDFYNDKQYYNIIESIGDITDPFEVPDLESFDLI